MGNKYVFHKQLEMKKLILLLLFIPLVSCNNSKNITEKDLSKYSVLYTLKANTYLENARNGNCNSFVSGQPGYYEPNERTFYMQDGVLQKRIWNYEDKTLLVDQTPKFIEKQHSIKFDELMFKYLYADIFCALKDKKYEFSRYLINKALNIYNSNILSYYNINDLEFINNYFEGISNFSNLIPE